MDTSACNAILAILLKPKRVSNMRKTRKEVST